MKKKLNKLTIAIFGIIIITSCNNDDNQGASLIDYSPVNVTLSTEENDVVISENETYANDGYSITVTATLDQMSTADIVVDLSQTSGTATSELAEIPTIIIPAGSLSASEDVVLQAVGSIQDDRTFAIGGEVRGNANAKLASDFELRGTINDDYINDVLDLTLSWDGTISVGDITIESLCELDFDLIVFDDSFNFLGYILGSSSCPEEGGLSGLPDGTYYLVVDLWVNPYMDLGLTETIPLALSWSQDYFPDTTGTIESSSYNLSSEDSDTGNGLGGLIVELVVTNGYEYTLSEY